MLKGAFASIAAMSVVALIGGCFVLRSGVIPANADTTPGAIETWAASTSLNATLERDAPKVKNPVAMTEANLIAGIDLYAHHCAICHGTAKGDAPATAIAHGLYSKPPQLATHGVEDDREGFSFWKIEHGIRWTAMPSWKDTLSDQQIWTIALVLKNMDKLPPAPREAWQKVTN